MSYCEFEIFLNRACMLLVSLAASFFCTLFFHLISNFFSFLACFKSIAKKSNFNTLDNVTFPHKLNNGEILYIHSLLDEQMESALQTSAIYMEKKKRRSLRSPSKHIDSRVMKSPSPPLNMVIAFRIKGKDDQLDKVKTATSSSGEVSTSGNEESLVLMKDSPCWEEEEIRADSESEIKPVKAEIRLLVKTSDIGKESVEIRSIKEFVEPKNKNLQQNFEKVIRTTRPPKANINKKLISFDSSSNSKFVRPNDTYPLLREDDFNLLAQVRGNSDF